jgi:hypothetical protein
MIRLSEILKTVALTGNLVLASIFSVMSPNNSTPPESTPQAIRYIDVTPYLILPPTTTALPAPTTTVPEPEDSRIPSDKTRRCPQFEQTFRDYGLVPVKVFSYIAWRESGCNPDAVNAKWDANGKIIWTLNKNGSYDSGLLQVNSSWQTVTKNICGGGIKLLRTLDCNLKVSKYLLDNGGLNHWSL